MEEKSKKEFFDRMSVDIGTEFLKVQMMISEVTMELLQHSESMSQELDLQIPHHVNGNFIRTKAKSITYDSESEELLVHGDESIPWHDLNLVAQDLIATYLHMHFTSKTIFNDLS